MARAIALLLVTLAACGEDEPPPPKPSECAEAQDPTGALPAFCLFDANPTSPTGDDAVSPRDYLESVSGWYFATAT